MSKRKIQAVEQDADQKKLDRQDRAMRKQIRKVKKQKKREWKKSRRLASADDKKSAGVVERLERVSHRACLVVETAVGAFVTTHLHHNKSINEIQVAKLTSLLQSEMEKLTTTTPLVVAGDFNGRIDGFCGGSLVNHIPKQIPTFIETMNGSQSIDAVASNVVPTHVEVERVEHRSVYEVKAEWKRVRVFSCLKKLKREYQGRLCDHRGRQGSCRNCQLRVPFSVLHRVDESWFGHPSTLRNLNSDHGWQFLRFPHCSLLNLNVLDHSAYLLTAFTLSDHGWIMDPRRFDAQCDLILSLDPDVVTLQEVGPVPRRVFQRRLGVSYTLFFAAHTPSGALPGGRSDGVMVCVRRSIDASCITHHFSSVA